MLYFRLTRVLASVALPFLLAWGGWSCANDGIAKTYMGREIAPVTGWQGAAWLERREREREERSDVLIAELGLKPGMVVADIGAGTGYHARQIAPLVAPAGRVYAVDVQPEMVRFLTDVSKQPGFGNIEPILGGVDDVKLPASTVDLAFMVDVYHELEYPHEVLASIIRGPVAWIKKEIDRPSAKNDSMEGNAFWEGSRQPCFLKAVALEVDNQWQKLAALAQRWTKAEPQNIGAWLALGKAHLDAREHPAAIDAYQHAVKLNADNANAWYGLGLSYIATGEKDGVAKAQEKLALLDPRLAEELSNTAKGG
ncbi:MAG: methyltransferase domain-containing protein [Burkholderiales bacterium]|nr:methyltransferase domain-containing protein [Burkholderiales bacterium]